MLVLVVKVMMDPIKKKKFDVRKKKDLKKIIETILFIVEVEAEILNSNIDQAQLQRLRNGEQPGALWHLFRSDDVKQIREYLSRVCPYDLNSINLFSRLDSTKNFWFRFNT